MSEYCPLLKKKCIEAKCKFWVHIRGKHPQSHAELDMPDCSIKWLPVLLIENAQMSRQTGAAVESFRNEVVKQGPPVVIALGDNHENRPALPHSVGRLRGGG